MRVWVTRAEPGAADTAARLRALGHTPLIGSLLETRPLDPGCAEPPADTGALAFTSANAVRAFGAWSARREWPVFAVGDATAKAARDTGFKHVRSAAGDVAALTALIAAEPPAGAVLHARARETAGDLSEALSKAGVRVHGLTLYDAVTLDPPREVAKAWRRGAVDAVLLHSPKAARALAAWLSTQDGSPKPTAWALGLSPACLAPLSAANFSRLQAATTPNDATLLDILA